MKNSFREKIVLGLTDQIKGCKGLEVFASGPNQFEQWIQVAICGILKTEGMSEIRVETNHKKCSPDIEFNNGNEQCAIELKVLIAGGGGRGDLGRVVKDIKKYNGKDNKSDLKNVLILFAIFPFNENENIETWVNKKKYYCDIKKMLAPIKGPEKFDFCNGTRGYIFSGFVGIVS